MLGVAQRRHLGTRQSGSWQWQQVETHGGFLMTELDGAAVAAERM
jgi:hypothetical protein